MDNNKKLSDKKIDLLMLLFNIIVLGFPLFLTSIFFKINLEEYVFKDYIFSSTLNKFAIILTINSLFVLCKQHNLPSKCYGKKKLKRVLRYVFKYVSWCSLGILLLTDIILLIASLFNITKLNINFITTVTIVNLFISIFINFFSIFLIKKYTFDV